MKNAERIVMVLLLLVIFGGAIWFYFSLQYKQAAVRDAVARGEYEIPNDPKPATGQDDDWRKYYPVLVPVIIGSTTVQASIADSLPERIKGLSDTPSLPDGVVKLFAFGIEGEHSIWMKDMNYAIDIIWVAKAGNIVHIKENATPQSYPESFVSPKLAWYVIEAPAGFVKKERVSIGDKVVVPQ